MPGRERCGSRNAGKRNARDALQVIKELEITPACKEVCEGISLAEAELQPKQAARREGGGGLWDEAPVKIEAVGPGEQSRRRFVIANLRMEERSVGVRDVGKVGEDGVEGAGLLREQVGLAEQDAIRNLMRLSVFVSDDEGCGGKLQGKNFGEREVGCESNRYGPGAGADVGKAERPVFRQAGEGGFDKQLGFRPGDEGRGGDAESETEEFLGAGDVLDGFAGKATVNGGGEGGVLDGGEGTIGIDIKDGTGQRQGVQEQKLCVAAGGRDKVAVMAQLLRGLCQGFTDRHCGWFWLGSVGRMVEETASWW